MVCFVAASLFRYPFITCGPRTHTSPSSPTPRSLPTGSTMRSSVLGTVTPTEPGTNPPVGRGVGDRRQLGHAVALHHLAVEPGAALEGQLRRQRRGAGEHHLQSREVVLVDERVLGQRDHHRRGHERAGEPVLLVEGEELLEVEPRHRHDRGAGRQAHVHQHLHAVDVEERQHRDEGLVVVQGDHAGGLGEVGHQVAVGEHHALGEAGGARRVGQHHDVVEVDRHLLGQRITVERRQRRHALRLADHEQLLHARCPAWPRWPPRGTSAP